MSTVFQDIGLSPVNLVLHSSEQLQLYSKLAKGGSLILHVDATGGIIRRAEYVKRQLFLFSAVVDSPNEDTSCVSISDCLMEECRTENAEFWLRRLRNDIARMQQVHLNHDHSVPAVVVVDFSWVLLHACASVFCGTTVVGLLKQTFETSIKPVAGNNRACSLFSCSSHFLSRAARTLRKFFSHHEKESLQLVLHCIGGLICAPNLKDASLLWDLMLGVFGASDSTGKNWKDMYEHLLRLLECVPQDIREYTRDTDPDTMPEPDNENDETTDKRELKNNSLRRMSPYYAYFTKPSSASAEGSPSNRHFNPAVLSYIHSMWLPLYGLWGQPAIADNNIRHYLTNAKVECWFR